MFSYKRTIHLRETDSTGVLFFSELLNLGLEALEAYFLTRGFTLKQLIEEGKFLMPIVHAEADFSAPIYVGDQVEIELKVEKLGNSSFTMGTRIHRKGLELGVTKIVHVVISRETNRSIPLPEWLIRHLHSL